MRKATREEFESADLKERRGRHIASPNENVYKEIDLMGLGDILFIEVTDWHSKTSPTGSSFPNRTRTMGRKYATRALANGNGWYVERIA